MYQIFGQPSSREVGVTTPAAWHQVKEGLEANLHKVVTYYRGRPLAVKNQHFLVRLIESLNIPISLNLERYVDNVENVAMRLSVVLKMTSAVYRGQIFEDVFYGGCPEILIATDQSFDIYEAQRKWRSLSAVRVLRHPVKNLQMKLPDGSVQSHDTGISVVLINIPLLAVQYRQWMISEQEAAANGESGTRPITEFIHGYVLPNMLASHLDYVIFNRIAALERGDDLDTIAPQHVHPFYLTDFTERLTQVQNQILIHFQKTPCDFVTIMKNVPMVHRANLEEVLMLPDMAPTFQLMWALSVARFPALEFLFETSRGGPSLKNRDVVTRIMNDVRNYRRNSIMKTLPVDMQKEINDEMDFLVDGAGNDSNLVPKLPLE